MSTRTVLFNFRFNGTLTDVTSAVLSDSAATYGVKRDDTNAVVVAAAAAMTKVDTGQYSYTFTEPSGYYGPYTAWVKAVYAGNTYYEEVELATNPTPPGSTSLCTVQFRVKLSDTAVSGAVCKAKLVGVNHAADGSILSNAELSDTTDAEGIAELQLVQRGAIVKGSGLYQITVTIAGCPVASAKTTIPNQSTILFEDLLKA